MYGYPSFADYAVFFVSLKHETNFHTSSYGPTNTPLNSSYSLRQWPTFKLLKTIYLLGTIRFKLIEGLPPMPPTPASRSRLGTFEPAKSMESGEVLALGNPCETAKQHSRVPAQGVAVWSAAPISFSRIQAQWVAVWSAEPISFGHL